MNKLYVALSLLKIMSEYRYIDSKLIAEKMEVSLRTAQRYLSELASMPFVEQDGDTHRYKLTESHNLNSNYTYDSQIAFIASMLDYAGQIFQDDDYIGKLKDKFNKVTSRPLILHETPEELDKELYNNLSMHINIGNTISFHYSKYKKNYDVVPVKLVYSDGYFYLAAIRLDETSVVKKFALAYISNVKAIGKNVNIDVPELVQDLHGNIWSNGDKTTVLARISGDVADYFRRRQIFPQQKIIHKDENSILLQCVVSKSDEFINAALPWAHSLSILEPKSYRDEYVDILKKGLELNN